MSIKDWPGGIVSKEQVVPSGPYLNSTASGMWTMDQAASYTKQGIWPTAGNVEPDVASNFSTYLYEGNSGTLSVNNGIDFAGDGGLVWIKCRDANQNHMLMDTVRGGTKYLNCNADTQEQTFSSGEQFSFSSTGFSSTAADFKWNNSQYNYASWSFKKQAKFFDIQTFSGNGATTRTLSHDLGAEVGMMIIKSRSSSAQGEWWVYHRSMNASPETKQMRLSENYAANNAGNVFGATKPTSTQFSVGSGSNYSGQDYIVYLFAHSTAADSMIQCGSYTNSSNGVEVNLGFEPQWLLTKSVSTGNWAIADKMRGWEDTGAVGDNFQQLRANVDNSENAEMDPSITSTGFKTYGEGGGGGSSGGTYIYMAVRAPMMIAPAVGTEVFNMDGLTGRTSGSWFRTNTGSSTTFPADFALRARPNTADEKNALTRILGNKMLRTDSAAAVTTSGNAQWDWMDGYADAVNNATFFSWMWKSAKSFFTVVPYMGNGTAGRTVSHNLGAVPEMIWVKKRSQNSNWEVYLNSFGGTHRIYLDVANAIETTSTAWNNTDATATTFSLGTSGQTNQNGGTFVAYLFGSLAGISKIGSYTGNGGSQTIDCGFTSGARFILIKRTDASGDWWVLDTVRGIASGNDSLITLNDATGTSYADVIDSESTGFKVDTTNSDFNASGGNYIFYAIS
jgi:hypothetical protein